MAELYTIIGPMRFMTNDTPTDHPGVKLPPPFTAAFWLLAGLYLNEKLGYSFPGRDTIWDGLSIMALSTSLLIIMWCFFTFRRHKTTILPHAPNAHLMTGGIFQLSRNPIYLAFLLAQAAIAFGLNAPLALLAVPITLIIFHYRVIKKEEAYLARRFGQDYLDYKLTTRRWL